MPSTFNTTLDVYNDITIVTIIRKYSSSVFFAILAVDEDIKDAISWPPSVRLYQG